MRRGAVVALVAVGVLGVPGVASAHKYKAWAGNPSAPPAGAPEQTQINAFLPAKMTIRKGDRISYGNRFIHTVSVLGKGVSPGALAVQDPAATYQGITAFDGTPFYFNNLPLFRY